MNTFNDVFQQSACSEYYRQYRPEWSDELIKSLIADSTGNREKNNQVKLDLAVDIGCGSGQSTRPLVPYFKKVIGVDISEAQLVNARKLHNPETVEYRYGSADKLPLPDNCTDVLTGSQVLHWILSKDMCKEVDRVLKPGGRFIFYGVYASNMQINFAEGLINGDQVRDSYKRLVSKLYEGIHQTLIASFEKTFYDPLSQYEDMKTNKEYPNYTTETNITGLIGLIKSFSGYWLYIKTHPDRPDPVEELQKKIIEIASTGSPLEDILVSLTFPMWMRCGTKPCEGI